MELSDSFLVARPIAETWAVLNDVERVAPCVPGALLQEVEGNRFRGVVRVKIGRINADYTGDAVFTEQNATDHKIVLTGRGLEGGGNGNAELTVTLKLEPNSDTTTRVNVDTDLTLSGRVAQMGKGVISEVGASLISQFAQNLSAMLDGERDARARVADGGAGERRTVEMPEPEAIDLMDAARAPLLKRLAAIAVLAVFVWWIVKRRR